MLFVRRQPLIPGIADIPEKIKISAITNPVNNNAQSLLETFLLEGKGKQKFTHSVILKHLLEINARKLQQQKDAGTL